MSTSEPLPKDELEQLVSQVNAYMTNPLSNRVVGGSQGSSPRFEAYHASLSLCSHKVRTVLAEKQQPYKSHAMNIMPSGKFVPHNYRPAYVRLRLKAAQQRAFVSGYSGASAVAVEGVDPLVVPTLVDHEEGKVIIDSRAICEHVAKSADTGTDLMPDDLLADIDRMTALVDTLPHVALMYGAHPEKDNRPKGLVNGITGIHAKKIKAAQTVLDQLPAGSDLRPAYEAKIAKESAAAGFVIDGDSMRAAHEAGRQHVADLEAQLKESGGPWVFGDRFTIADIQWTVSIFRLMWLGHGEWWAPGSGNDRVADYYARAAKRPSFRSAVVEWKYAYSPSPYIDDYASGGMVARFLLHAARETEFREVMFGSNLASELA
ncbi:MAG: glutathione S-transferase family protein [Pseudomonadota bacterium]